MELVTLFACLDVCYGTLKFKEEFFTRTGSHRIPRDYVTFASLATRKFVVKNDVCGQYVDELLLLQKEYGGRQSLIFNVACFLFGEILSQI